jgi:hypothetical protein
MTEPRHAPGSLESSIHAFVEGLHHAPWFGALGEPLTPSEIADAEAHLGGLGFDGIVIEGITDWPDARTATLHPQRDNRWRDAAQREAKALRLDANSAHGAESVLSELSHVEEAATALMLELATAAALDRGIKDESLTGAAARAATEAAYQAALALAAGAPASHPFRLKLNLFECGRWPLALIGNHFFLF